MKQLFINSEYIPKCCAKCFYDLSDCCQGYFAGSETLRHPDCPIKSLEQYDKEVQANAIRAFAKRLKLKKQDITYWKGADLVYGQGVSLKDIDELLKEYLNE